MRSGKGWILAAPLPVTQVHCIHLSSFGFALPSHRVLNCCFRPWLSISTTDLKPFMSVLCFRVSVKTVEWENPSELITMGSWDHGVISLLLFWATSLELLGWMQLLAGSQLAALPSLWMAFWHGKSTSSRRAGGWYLLYNLKLDQKRWIFEGYWTLTVE